MLQAELKILGGKHQGKAIPLSTKKFLVGREQDCHLRPNSDLVSRHHCVFSIDDYAVRLRDLGSTNGTRVNGKPLHGEVILKSGDQIGIGKLELELVIRQKSTVAAPAPSAPLSGLSGSDLDIAATTGTVEITAPLAGAEVASETSFELPTTFVPPTDETSTSLSADTAIIPGTAPAPFPGYPQVPAPAYPQAMPGYPPPAYPGYAAPMGYPQAMGYPGQYPGYAPQGYPGMPAYPMQQMPYVGGFPAQPTQPAASSDSSTAIEVKLPPPDQTGVKAPPPVAATPADAAAGPPKTEEKPSNTAADIIKSYMQKRRS